MALDCVSAVGAIPLDLSKVWIASGASGKALASYPGLSMVFYQEAERRPVPRYLDLSLYAGDEVPFTQSSNLVRALNASLARADWPAHYEEVAAMGLWLRRRLRDAGCTLVGERSRLAPHVVTIEIPAHVSATEIAESLEREGFLVCHASGYLQERNWIQICLMGEVSRDALPPLVRKLARMCR